LLHAPQLLTLVVVLISQPFPTAMSQFYGSLTSLGSGILARRPPGYPRAHWNGRAHS
jgi:hypothetical protein